MDDKAQTIVQLFAQLERRGYGHDDLRLVHDAYALAASLCTCHYRSSGRPLIHHSIGVASILASLGTDAPMIAAAVVHAVYLHGDFGTWRKRIDDDKRARVRRAAGSAAEEIVYHYSHADRDTRTFPAIRQRLDQLDAMERNLVLMRLADLLDIYGEPDALYCHNVAKRRIVARDFASGIVGVAGDLGFPSLAAELDRGFAAVRDATVPQALTAPPWKDGVIMPLSLRTRIPIALYQQLRAKVFAWTGR